MFGESPSLKMLETRRKLLVAESEIYRAQLGRDLETIQANIRLLRDEATTVKSVVSKGVTILSAFRALRESGRNGGSSFFAKVLRGARFASTVWQTFRPPER
jgi:hypothetical protein